MNASQTIRQTFFSELAAFAYTRASRAPDSERPYWLGRVMADRALAKLKSDKVANVILELRTKHCSTPAFFNLCAKLQPK